MKKIGNFILDIVIGVWFVIAIFVTICLLSYNEFQVAHFGKYSMLIMDSDELEPEFLEGDLLVVKRNGDSKIEIGDKVFYYNSAMDSSVLIYLDTVQEKEAVTKDETTYVINGEKVSGEYVIGKTASTKVYHKIGFYLGILLSKWGFMFIVIFPTLFAIIYEIMMIVELMHQKDDDAGEKTTISENKIEEIKETKIEEEKTSDEE